MVVTSPPKTLRELQQQKQYPVEQPTETQQQPTGPTFIQEQRQQRQEVVNLPSQAELTKSQATTEMYVKKLEQEKDPNTKYNINGKVVTRDQAIRILRSQASSAFASRQKLETLETYMGQLRNQGFTVFVDKYGKLVIDKPAGMSELESQLLQLKYYPYETITTKDGRQVSVDKAIQFIKTKQELLEKANIDWSGNLIQEFGDYFDYIKQSAVQSVFSPPLLFSFATGGLVDLTGFIISSSPATKLLYEYLSPGLLEQWKKDIEKERIEVQASVKISLDNAIEKAVAGDTAAIIGMAKKPVEVYGTIVATTYAGTQAIAYLNGAVSGAVAGTRTGTLLGYTGKQISVFTNYALKTGFGGLIAWEIGSNFANIYKVEQRLAKLREEYQNEIKKETDEKQKIIIKQKYMSKEEAIRKERTQLLLRFGALAVFIAIATGVATHPTTRLQAKETFGRGYRAGLRQTAFVGRTPRTKLLELYDLGLRLGETYEQVRSYKLRQINKTEQVTPQTLKVAKQALIKYGGRTPLKYRAVAGGSETAAEMTLFGRAPKDFEMIFQTNEIKLKAEAWIRQQLGLSKGFNLKNIGLDIHGPSMYTPGEPYNIMQYTSKPPIRFTSKDYWRISMGELTLRKGSSSVALVAGKGSHPGRVKDISDFFTYMKSQSQALQTYGTPEEVALGQRLQQRLTEYAALWQDVYGVDPYTVVPSAELFGPYGGITGYSGRDSTMLLTQQEQALGITQANFYGSYQPEPIFKGVGTNIARGYQKFFSDVDLATTKITSTISSKLPTIPKISSLLQSTRFFSLQNITPTTPTTPSYMRGAIRYTPTTPYTPTPSYYSPSKISYTSPKTTYYYGESYYKSTTPYYPQRPYGYPKSSKIQKSKYQKQPYYLPTTYYPTKKSIYSKYYPKTSGYPVTKQKPKKHITKPIGAIQQKPKAIETTSKGYHTYVREKGKWKQVTKKPLTETQAYGLGVKVTDNTPTRSFQIRETNKPAQSNPRLEGIWPQQDYRYRKPVKKGSEQKTSPIYIEKTKYAIDTKGELQGITVKGWKAKNKKLLESNPIKTKKTTINPVVKANKPKETKSNGNTFTPATIGYKPVKLGGM